MTTSHRRTGPAASRPDALLNLPVLHRLGEGGQSEIDSRRRRFSALRCSRLILLLLFGPTFLGDRRTGSFLGGGGWSLSCRGGGGRRRGGPLLPHLLPFLCLGGP